MAEGELGEAPAAWRTPMLAQLVKPTDHHRAGRAGEWQYEQKLDGLRCLAVRNEASVELWSRNRLSFTARFPHIVEALLRLAADRFVIDGELVVRDDRGRTSFARLQHGGGRSMPMYCVFDLVHLLGRDTTGLPLADRQALLAQTVQGVPAEVISTVGPLVGDPADLLRRACAAGWEGLVAKRVGSPYRPGRSGDWQKLKCTASQELVIGGWTDPNGARVGFGALLVGYYDEAGRLRYAGKVGTGFDARLLVDLHRQLTALARPGPPFEDAPRLKGVHWVEPRLVGAVTFSEWTSDGRLRHPAFQGLRPDKDPETVRREQPA